MLKAASLAAALCACGVGSAHATLLNWQLDPDGAGPLKGNDPHPLGADNRNDNGDVWGHFITIVRFVPGGTESQDLCQFDEIGLCTAVLTE